MVPFWCGGQERRIEMNKGSVEMLLIEKDRVEFMIRRRYSSLRFSEQVQRVPWPDSCSWISGTAGKLGGR